MWAAVLRGAEQVSIEEVPLPPIGPGDVLVRVEAATTCGTDLKVFLRGGHPRMITVPSVFGHEFSGTIAAVGARVAGFQAGMRVVANNSAPCYQCVECRRHLPNLCEDLLFINGTYAEYMRVPERVVRTNLLAVPDGVPAAVAAMTEPLACVLNGLDAAHFGLGDTVVVNGDGPSGLMMAAMAKQRGAQVIVCGRAPQRLALAKQFGADVVINYAEVPNQVEAVRAHTEGHRGVDVAIEAVGRPEVWAASVAMARRGGQVIFYGGCPGDSVVQLPTGPLHYDQLTLLGVFHNTPHHVRLALSLLSENKWPWASLITHALPLTKLHHAFELMMSRQALKVSICP